MNLKLNNPRKNLTGMIFGKLKVLGLCELPRKGNSGIRYNCLCDCGNSISIVGQSLVRINHPTKSCGCLKKTHFIDLTNQKFNNLTVIRYLGKDNTKNNIYECSCDCGGKIITQGSDVKTGKVKSCGCRNFSKQTTDCVQKGAEPLFKSLYVQYSGSERRGYEFNLTYDFFKEIILKNCHYCGSEPYNIKRDKRSSGDKILKYTGIDRVDNDKGYSVENVVPCCRNCNIAKHTYSLEFFKEHIIKIYKNLKLGD